MGCTGQKICSGNPWACPYGIQAGHNGQGPFDHAVGKSRACLSRDLTGRAPGFDRAPYGHARDAPWSPVQIPHGARPGFETATMGIHFGWQAVPWMPYHGMKLGMPG